MLPSAYFHLPGKFICYKKSFPIIYIKFSYITLERDASQSCSEEREDNGEIPLSDLLSAGESHKYEETEHNCAGWAMLAYFI